ncbi:response regulator transcription factor [Paenibacillus cremeus]|uniref:Response regulator n=1 Tax=Paenibacillus cremeus TaxID=2163881 RepID=A0A559K4E6_9BACL|nr:response regulator [Paenibacillus cremeus]TVY06994.1 response regulator [Paenibacillus cremeus]
MNILVVDDEKSIREGIKRTLNHAFPRIHVLMVQSCQEAAAVLLNERIDAVLLDIMMPGMNGLELLASLRESHRGMKVVIISAHSKFTYAQEALRLGARDYVLKPVGKDRLIGIMSELEREWQEEQRQLTEKDRLDLNLNYLREAVFRRWVQGLDIGSFDLSRLAQNHPRFHLIRVQFDGGQDLTLSNFVVENVLSEWIGLNGCGFVVSLETNLLIGVVTLREECSCRFVEFETGARGHLDRCLNVPYTMTISCASDNFYSIPDRIRKLKSPGTDMTEQPLPASRGDETIQLAMQYIRAHFRDNLSLEKVASIVYLNPVYFSQLFKQKTGIGYKEYVIQLRMERATELLSNRTLRVVDVARLVGYDDLRHFTQVFRKKYNRTPTEYRLEAK